MSADSDLNHHLQGLLLTIWANSWKCAHFFVGYLLISKLLRICFLWTPIIHSVCPLKWCPPASTRCHFMPKKSQLLGAATSCSPLSGWIQQEIPHQHMNLLNAMRKLSLSTGKFYMHGWACSAHEHDSLAFSWLSPPQYSTGLGRSIATDWSMGLRLARWSENGPILCTKYFFFLVCTRYSSFW